jgi:hypothetical protein
VKHGVSAAPPIVVLCRCGRTGLPTDGLLVKRGGTLKWLLPESVGRCSKAFPLVLRRNERLARGQVYVRCLSQKV